jgi:hypothetical protein
MYSVEDGRASCARLNFVISTYCRPYIHPVEILSAIWFVLPYLDYDT